MMKWRLGILAAIVLALLSLYPQAALVYNRGTEYNGAAFVNDNDESVYIAYLQALIDGQPRKNNIYSGGDLEPSESFLSIQALPAYAPALFARSFGLSAESLFPVLSFLFAIAAAASLYWLLYQLTEHAAFSAVAALFVLVIGANVAGYGTAKLILGLGQASASLPFLRRYTPGLAFPFFFVLMAMVYRAYAAKSVRRSTWIVASVSFIVLLYSYFYLWTAALAWMSAVAFLTLFFPSLRAKGLFRKFWLPVTVICGSASLPYLWLLNRRSASTDSFQALEQTRELVWQRPSIWLGSMLVIFLVFILRRSTTDESGPAKVIFAAACALLPILVFEQHLITGYSLQPFHYNLYIAPYIVLIAFATICWMLFSESLRRLGWLSGGVLILGLGAWGLVESHLVMTYRWVANVNRDKILPVNQRLRQLGRDGSELPGSAVTFNSNLFQADHQPSSAPQGVLWSEHMPWASTISVAEARHRYFSHMYLTGQGADRFDEAMGKCPASPECKAIFGWRVIPTLAIGDHRPTRTEADEVAREYRAFLGEVSIAGPPGPRLSYAVIENTEKGFDLTNIDRWYQRDAGETVGRYTIYRLTRREGAANN